MSSRKMVLNRNFTLDTTFGQSIRFEKDVPTHVPPICHAAAMAIGAVFDDGNGAEVPDENAPYNPTDPAERAAKALAAVTVIADRNDKDDFTGSGAPKLDAVIKVAGFKVDKKELATAWQARHDAIAAAKMG